MDTVVIDDRYLTSTEKNTYCELHVARRDCHPASRHLSHHLVHTRRLTIGHKTGSSRPELRVRVNAMYIVWTLVGLFLIDVFVLKTSGLNVTITYSFSLPFELGVATPSTENCCPFGILHSNDTQGMVPPLVFGLGTQKGGTTTLHKYLHKNPLFETPLWKELQFLASSKRNMTYQKYLTFWKSNRLRDKAIIEDPDFQDLMDSKILFEVTPNYIMVWFLPLISQLLLIPASFQSLSS